MTNQNLDSNNNGQADKADDSDKLGGATPSVFAKPGQDETVGGAWNFSTVPKINGTSQDTRYIRGDTAGSTGFAFGIEERGNFHQTLGSQNESFRLSGAVGTDGTAGRIRHFGDGWFPRGSKFQYFFQTPSNYRLITAFGVSAGTGDSHYEVWHFGDTGQTHIVYDGSGSGNSSLNSASTAYTGTDTYRVVVDFDTAGDGTIVVEVYTYNSGGSDTLLGSVSASHTTAVGDGFGAYQYGTGAPKVDQIELL